MSVRDKLVVCIHFVVNHLLISSVCCAHCRFDDDIFDTFFCDLRFLAAEAMFSVCECNMQRVLL